MNLKQYLTLMCLGTALCWAMFLLVIFNMPPDSSQALLFFYSSLFMASIGTLSIISLSIRVGLLKKRVLFRQVKKSFRQSFLLGILIISMLFLQGKKILVWWNVIFLIIALAILECILVSSNSRKS